MDTSVGGSVGGTSGGAASGTSEIAAAQESDAVVVGAAEADALPPAPIDLACNLDAPPAAALPPAPSDEDLDADFLQLCLLETRLNERKTRGRPTSVMSARKNYLKSKAFVDNAHGIRIPVPAMHMLDPSHDSTLSGSELKAHAANLKAWTLEYANMASSKEIKGLSPAELAVVLKKGAVVAVGIGGAFDRAGRRGSKASTAAKVPSVDIEWAADVCDVRVGSWAMVEADGQRPTIEAVLRSSKAKNIAYWCSDNFVTTPHLKGAIESIATRSKKSWRLEQIEKVRLNLAFFAAISALVRDHGNGGVLKVPLTGGHHFDIKLTAKKIRVVSHATRLFRAALLVENDPTEAFYATAALADTALEEGADDDDDADEWEPIGVIEAAAGTVHPADVDRFWSEIIGGDSDESTKTARVAAFKCRLAALPSEVFPRDTRSSTRHLSCDIHVCDWAARDPSIILECPFCDGGDVATLNEYILRRAVGMHEDTALAQARYRCRACYARRRDLKTTIKDPNASTAAVGRAKSRLKATRASWTSLNSEFVCKLARKYPEVGSSLPAFVTKRKAVTRNLLTYIIQQQHAASGGPGTMEATLEENRSATHQKNLATLVARWARAEPASVDFSNPAKLGLAMRPTPISDTFLSSVCASWYKVRSPYMCSWLDRNGRWDVIAVDFHRKFAASQMKNSSGSVLMSSCGDIMGPYGHVVRVHVQSESPNDMGMRAAMYGIVEASDKFHHPRTKVIYVDNPRHDGPGLAKYVTQGGGLERLAFAGEPVRVKTEEDCDKMVHSIGELYTAAADDAAVRGGRPNRASSRCLMIGLDTENVAYIPPHKGTNDPAASTIQLVVDEAHGWIVQTALVCRVGVPRSLIDLLTGRAGNYKFVAVDASHDRGSIAKWLDRETHISESQWKGDLRSSIIDLPHRPVITLFAQLFPISPAFCSGTLSDRAIAP
jgi:hypothetical protein